MNSTAAPTGYYSSAHHYPHLLTGGGGGISCGGRKKTSGTQVRLGSSRHGKQIGRSLLCKSERFCERSWSPWPPPSRECALCVACVSAMEMSAPCSGCGNCTLLALDDVARSTAINIATTPVRDLHSSCVLAWRGVPATELVYRAYMWLSYGSALHAYLLCVETAC